MAVLPIIIETQILQPPPSQRAHRRWLKDAHRRMGEEWQGEMLSARFRPGARYPHKRRTASYRKQKRRAAERGVARFDGKVTNVYTGRMMDRLLSASQLRAFPTRVTVTKTGTRYIDMRPWKSNQPDKWGELSTLLPREQRRLSDVFLQRYEQNRDAERRPVNHKP